MKAAVLRGVADIRLEEWPVPTIGQGELLLRVRACGLCGTDVHKAMHLTIPTPAVLGHEICGEVAEVGPGVTRFRTGDRVALTHHTPCFSCDLCRRGHHTLCPTWKRSNLDPGGFAEYIRVPAAQAEHNTFLVPEGLSDAAAATLEPLACVVRGFRRAPVSPGESVLVMGAGPIGILQIQTARYYLAGKIIAADISPYRLQQALRFGADYAINNGSANLPEEIRRLTDGAGVDYVILAAPVPALLSQAVDLVSLGGRVLVFAPVGGGALPIDASRFFNHEISVIGSFSSGPDDLQRAHSLLVSGQVRADEMVTHQVGLSGVGEAIKLVQSPGAEVMKVVVTPGGD